MSQTNAELEARIRALEVAVAQLVQQVKALATSKTTIREAKH